MQVLPGRVNEGMTLIGIQENWDRCERKQDKAFKTREPGTWKAKNKDQLCLFLSNTQGSVEHKKIDEEKA